MVNGVFVPSNRTTAAVDTSADLIFCVLHPMYIFSHFLALRSTPRELDSGQPICYMTRGSDGRLNSATATDATPQFLFLQRSEKTHTLVPYAPFKSAIDISLGDIKSSLWISGSDMAAEGLPSEQQTAIQKLADCMQREDVDASQLTALGELKPAYMSAATNHHHMRIAAYVGIAQDLARSMNTNTDNKQFREVLAAIFPFMCTSIANRLASVCTRVDNADSSVLERKEQLILLDKLTFRLHHNIIHTEPKEFRDYDTYVPHHLTILSSFTGVGADIPSDEDAFLYYFRSSAIKLLVYEHMYANRRKETSLLMSFIQSACSSSDVGFFYEYSSIRQLIDHVRTDIKVSSLVSKRPMDVHIKLHNRRVSYFHRDEHVKWSRKTLFVPLKSNYTSFDAIGSCKLPTGKDGHLEKHLVFYQMTIRGQHLVDVKATTKLVSEWKERAGGLPAILVFVTDNSDFTVAQKSYAYAGLTDQYVYVKNITVDSASSPAPASAPAPIAPLAQDSIQSVPSIKRKEPASPTPTASGPKRKTKK
jgi:hypothetical protein